MAWHLRLALLVVLLGGGACGDGTSQNQDGAVPDQSGPGDMPLNDGGQPIFAQLTMTGCSSLVMVQEIPRCTGTVPLTVTMVPISSYGVNAWSWTLQGGNPASSRMPSPRVTYSLPGAFAVDLVVGGSAGSARAVGEVVVAPAATAAACETNEQCALGYNCLCGSSVDGGVSCPSELGGGLCTRHCDGLACGSGDRCVDLSHSQPEVPDGGVADPWRKPLCLPGCNGVADCRAGFLCRELPALAAGAHAGGAFTWQKACFATVLGDVGSACMSAEDSLDPSSCLLGMCLPLGARAICSLDCTATPCSPGASCAFFTGDPTSPRCLARCPSGQLCSDPLLEPREANPDAGALGFYVVPPDPPGTNYCSPKRCTAPANCAPAGRCDALDGGSGFCRGLIDAGVFP